MDIWYNREMHHKMYEKFITKHPETFEEVKTLLEGDNFEEFSLACNYLESLSYKGLDRIGGYGSVGKLRGIANQRVRNLIGVDAATLFDMVVKKSKQELWGGDELYKLFSYDLPPYYVRRCIKSTLYVISTPMEHMTIEGCLKVADYIYHPPYWDVYNEDFSETEYERSKVRKKECLAWRKIAEFLFHGNITGAYEFLKENDIHYGK